MIMKKFFIVSVLMVFALLGLNCKTTLKPAMGEEDEVIVVADSIEFVTMEHSLRQVFEKEIFTPQPEKLFYIRRINYDELERFKNRKNIVFAAPINSGSDVSKFIETSVDSSAKEKILKGESSYIFRYDLWAKNQIVILISSDDIQSMEFAIMNNADKFLYTLQKISDKRLSESTYNSRYENKKLQAQLLKNYGWMVYCQADYVLAVDRPDKNFVWLRRSPDTAMERWIFISWVDNATPEYLNADSIYAIRNRLTKEFYRTSDDNDYVEIADSAIAPVEVNFKGRYALFTQGLWRTTDKFMGGPFINYTFYDEAAKRIYVLDGSVFAPKFYKRKIIQQVDVILQTFLSKEEMSKDWIEDLMDEL